MKPVYENILFIILFISFLVYVFYPVNEDHINDGEYQVKVAHQDTIQKIYNHINASYVDFSCYDCEHNIYSRQEGFEEHEIVAPYNDKITFRAYGKYSIIHEVNGHKIDKKKLVVYAKDEIESVVATDIRKSVRYNIIFCKPHNANCPTI